MAGDLAAFESTVLDQAPSGAVVIGASLSPDGRVWRAARTILPSANYLMDDLFVRDGDRCQLHSGPEREMAFRVLKLPDGPWVGEAGETLPQPVP